MRCFINRYDTAELFSKFKGALWKLWIQATLLYQFWFYHNTFSLLEHYFFLKTVIFDLAVFLQREIKFWSRLAVVGLTISAVFLKKKRNHFWQGVSWFIMLKPSPTPFSMHPPLKKSHSCQLGQWHRHHWGFSILKFICRFALSTLSSQLEYEVSFHIIRSNSDF